MNNFFAAPRATPQSALGADVGAILSADDPRFSLGKVEDYRKLTLAKLKTDIGDRLAHGAIEIGIAGDIDEVRVWRTARTQMQIRDNMCQKFITAPADLVAYYRLDQANGTTAGDNGAVPTNGTLLNFSGSNCIVGTGGS